LALIADEKAALGYNREVYEHSLQLPEVFKGQSATFPTTGGDGEFMYLFRLGGLLDSAEKVKEIAGLEEVPVVREGVNEMGPIQFCVVGRGGAEEVGRVVEAEGSVAGVTAYGKYWCCGAPHRLISTRYKIFVYVVHSSFMPERGMNSEVFTKTCRIVALQHHVAWSRDTIHNVQRLYL
jgi:hypothetical protein